MPIDPLIIGGGLKLLGGLLGRKKAPTPAQNILSQVKGARQAEAEYGVNFLTALQHGQPGGSMAQGDVAPLASLSILGDFITENFSEEAKDRREHNELATDLLRVQLDQARSAVYLPPPPSAVEGAALTGGRTGTLAANAGFTSGELQMKLLGPDREVKQAPTEDMSGFMRIRNGLTDEDGFLVPGSDGEPLDIWQVPVVAGAWAADKAWELGSRAGDWLATSDSSPLQKPRFKPDGYTADGKPFWQTANGITFNRPIARDGGKDY